MSEMDTQGETVSTQGETTSFAAGPDPAAEPRPPSSPEGDEGDSSENP